MIYELRIYEPVPGKLETVHKVLEVLKPLAIKHGVTPIAIWEAPMDKDVKWDPPRRGLERPHPYLGKEAKYVFYLLAYKNMEDRKRAWNAFRADPELAKRAAEAGAQEGPFEASITNILLYPAKYSPMQ